MAEDEVEDVTVRGSQAAGFVSRANVETSPREITDTASLLEPLPGVHVRRLGADDGFATLSVRGTSSNEVAIYLAGVPLTGGADPSLDLSTLPLWPGSGAKVYRSFAPATLGPGSLGGVLTIDPPRAIDPQMTEAWAAIGSYGARRMRVGDVRSLDDSKDGARVATAISASRSDDDFSYFDPLRSRPGADVYSRRTNAGHADVNGLVSLFLPVPTRSGDGRLTVTWLAQARQQELPGTIALPTPYELLASNREVASIDLALPISRGEIDLRAWAKREETRLTDNPATATLDGSASHTNDTIFASGGSFGWRGRPQPEVTIDARVDGRGERFAPGTDIDITEPPSATRASVGAAIDANVHASRALTLTASGRADAWVDASTASNAHREVRPTAHLGGEWIAGPIAFAAHGGAVARPPSFIELYGDRGQFLGDPSLCTETAWTIDGGARGHAGSGRFRVDAEADGFATWADDLITFVPQGAYGHERATNIGRARIAGVEATVDTHVAAFDLRASYTLLATENESACTAQSGALGGPVVCDRPPLPGRPKHDLVADLTYHLYALALRYGIDVVSGILADETGDVVVPARILQSVGARFDVPGVRGLRLAFDARNLANIRAETYTTALGSMREPIGDIYDYPLPGRTFLLTARYLVTRP